MTYIKQLTFLRFIAAVAVVIYHFGKMTSPFDTGIIRSMVDEASIAVSFFFFLSGVVLTINYFPKPLLRIKIFLLKRFARIYALYVLALILSIILAMVFNGAYPRGSSIVLQLFALHAWVPGICLEINFPAWSISVEVFFYLLFPLLLWFMRQISDRMLMFTVISIWILSIAQHYLFTKYVYVGGSVEIDQLIAYFPLWHLNTFLFGCFCAKYILKQSAEPVKNYLKARLMYVFGLIVLFAILVTEPFFKHWIHNGMLSPVFFLTIAGLALDQSRLTEFLGNKLGILFGNASYGIYLFQWPVFIAFSALFEIHELTGWHFYLYLTGLILFSIFIYQFFERKMQRLILNRWND